ncbi:MULTISPECIES: hypothetical protein [unclassified Rathayibacter]|uniref:hypothetical protein n=1 Tax=unclassified Rathayibacter TaxID=2609250 RepID=UPI0011B0C262|nr:MULTISPECIES: hypothetical protein [unclassified Rathayibacter]
MALAGCSSGGASVGDAPEAPQSTSTSVSEEVGEAGGGDYSTFEAAVLSTYAAAAARDYAAICDHIELDEQKRIVTQNYGEGCPASLAINMGKWAPETAVLTDGYTFTQAATVVPGSGADAAPEVYEGIDEDRLREADDQVRLDLYLPEEFADRPAPLSNEYRVGLAFENGYTDALVDGFKWDGNSWVISGTV